MLATQPHHRLGYRSDIEGLRAVAILLVVAAHANISWLAGGFIGVDVFFVLSGYLITGLLVREVEATGELRFAAFYARRFRRLLPGLLAMLIGTCALAYLLVAPADQPSQATAAASAAAWISNFHFAFSSQGYFSPGAEKNLFLHTWSLGVEEQFYLVWPVLLVLGLGAWTGASRAASPVRLKITLSLVLLLSFLASLWWTRSDPDLAFYMMPSRAWQFAMGALVWLYCGTPLDRLQPIPTRQRGAQVILGLATHPKLGWIGLACIILAALLLDAEVQYPGAWALLPSIGTAMILASGARIPQAGVGAVLSLGPMQALGRLSYSWYLWHWPVLLLGATVISVESAPNRLALVLLSLAMAALSYRFVETPLRHNQRLIIRPRIAVFGSLAIIILAGAGAIRWHNSAFDRMSDPEQARYLQARTDAPVIYGMGCDEWYQTADVRICEFGPKDAMHTAVAIGDSIGLQWFPAFSEVFDKPGWRLLVITKSACPMVDEPIFYPRIGREYTECAEWRKNALQQVATLNPDIVMLGSTFTYDYTPRQWREGTARVLQSISEAARRVVILRSTPTLPFDGPSCAAPRSSLYSALIGTEHCSALADNARSDNVYRALIAAADGFSNVRVIDMTDAVCPDGVCHAELNDAIVFRDTQHLSATFAKELSGVLGSQLNLPD